jgi:hypothetical protein
MYPQQAFVVAIDCSIDTIVLLVMTLQRTLPYNYSREIYMYGSIILTEAGFSYLEFFT